MTSDDRNRWVHRYTNSRTAYGWIHILLHWVTAVTVIGLFLVGWWMVDLGYYDDWYHTAPAWHKAVGLLLAGLIAVRLVWKYLNYTPRDLSVSLWEQKAAHFAHAILYLLLISMFITGYLISTAKGVGISVFDWFTVPAVISLSPAWADRIGQWHWYIAVALMLMVSLHTLAALRHHFQLRDRTLKRMLGFKQ